LVMTWLKGKEWHQPLWNYPTKELVKYYFEAMIKAELKIYE